MATTTLVSSPATEQGLVSSQQLQFLDQVSSALESAESVQELKQIRDRAAAVRVYAHEARLGLRLQNKAAEIKLRAERKAGRLLKAMRLRGGDRKSNGHHNRLNLADLGISSNQSKRWQKQAAVPEKQFEQFVREAESNGFELTAASLLRHMRGQVRKRDRDQGRPKSGSDGGSARAHAADELINHCRLLTSLLAPIWETSVPFQPRTIERRTLKRLLREVSQLAVSLKEHRDP